MAAVLALHAFSQSRDLGELSLVPKDIHQVLKSLPLLQDLDGDELRALQYFMQIYTVKQGTVVFREGEPTNHLLIVVEGAVRITKKSDQGSERTLGLADRGKTLGEMAMLDGGPRSASCIANLDTVFVALTRERFHELTRAHPAVAVKILRQLGSTLSRRLRHTSKQLVEHLEM